jgi:hypothetical protein
MFLVRYGYGMETSGYYNSTQVITQGSHHPQEVRQVLLDPRVTLPLFQVLQVLQVQLELVLQVSLVLLVRMDHQDLQDLLEQLCVRM